jgi:hypothetical protein
MWVLLPVYAKTNYGCPKACMALFPPPTLVMVLLLQCPSPRVCAIVKRFICFQPVRCSMPRGGSVALAGLLGLLGQHGDYDPRRADFGTHFLYLRGQTSRRPICATLYEPLRLTWNVASGIGPLAGGFLNDTFNPHAFGLGPVWPGCSACCSLRASPARLILQARYRAYITATFSPHTADKQRGIHLNKQDARFQFSYIANHRQGGHHQAEGATSRNEIDENDQPAETKNRSVMPARHHIELIAAEQVADGISSAPMRAAAKVVTAWAARSPAPPG